MVRVEVGKRKPRSRKVRIAGQVGQDRFWPRDAFEVLRGSHPDLNDALDHLFGHTRRVVVRSTRTRKQDRHIPRISLGQALFPAADHTLRAPNRISELVTGPVGMLLEQGAQISPFADPIDFHFDLVSWEKRYTPSESIAQGRRLGKLNLLP